MTLDEAIVRCFEVAEGNEYKINNKPHLFDSQQEMDDCARCAAEHRQLAEWLKKLKKLQEERKRGKWMLKFDYFGKTYGECSICHMRNYAGNTRFCPLCGTLMNGGEQE